MFPHRAIQRPSRPMLPLAGLVLALVLPVSAEDIRDADAPVPARKAFIASLIFAAIPQHFAHWDDANDLDLNQVYRDYLDLAMAAETRHEFSTASMAFLAAFNNGHTRFTDRELQKSSGTPLDFSIHYIDDQWLVSESERDDLSPGDVITKIDDQSIEDFFRAKLPYISRSREVWARRVLLGHRGTMGLVHLPLRFTLTLSDGRTVAVDRTINRPGPDEVPQGSWLETDRIAYLRIPAFHKPTFEEQAIEWVERFATAEALVIDLRGNAGGTTPSKLMARLFDRPYPWWKESSAVQFGTFSLNRPQLVWETSLTQPEASAYSGAIVLLIDAGCFSACEDFAMPFKHTDRAVLVGETTGGSSGQPHFIGFKEGFTVSIGAKREHFPDGTPFESVGISPDVEAMPSRADLEQGRDRTLERAIEALRSQSVATAPSHDASRSNPTTAMVGLSEGSARGTSPPRGRTRRD